MKNLALITWTALLPLLLACSAQNSDASKEAISSNFQETLQLQLLDAKAGDVITIPEGTHHLNRSLSLTVDGVTIRGAGMDKSILSHNHGLPIPRPLQLVRRQALRGFALLCETRQVWRLSICRADGRYYKRQDKPHRF